MAFDLVSTTQADATGFSDGIRELVRKAELLLVAETGASHLGVAPKGRHR